MEAAGIGGREADVAPAPVAMAAETPSALSKKATATDDHASPAALRRLILLPRSTGNSQPPTA